MTTLVSATTTDTPEQRDEESVPTARAARRSAQRMDVRPRALVTHPSAELYGSDRMLLESVTGLVRAGWRVTVLLGEPGPLHERVRAAGAECHLVATPVLRKSATTPGGLVRLAGSALAALGPGWRALRRARPDVVCVSTLTTPLWLVLARLSRTPVVCHVHEAEGSAPALVRRVLAAPLLLADELVVNSSYALGVLTGSWPSLGGRSGVVLNGVVGPPAPPRPRTRAAGEPLRLLYVGRLSERKGVLVALDALEQLVADGEDVVLTLLGSVYAEHVEVAAELDRRLALPQLRGRVERHAFSDGVWDHLAACDALLVPSVLPEPFGNTAVEGLLAARPVVASRVGGLPEAVEGAASARSVPPGDPAALAAAVREVGADLDRSSALAVEDAAAAAARYAPSRYRAQVVEVLQRRAAARAVAPAAPPAVPPAEETR